MAHILFYEKNMATFASDICKISGSLYSGLFHGERSMAIIRTRGFPNWVPFFAQQPQNWTLIQEKQATVFKMYSDTLISDFKFFFLGGVIFCSIKDTSICLWFIHVQWRWAKNMDIIYTLVTHLSKDFANVSKYSSPLSWERHRSWMIAK